MDTTNRDWASLIGTRALYSRLSQPPYEDKVLEISPSGDHVRFEKTGWERAASCRLVELLEPARFPEVVPGPHNLAVARRVDFTPEEVADLPYNLDLGFTREELAEACKLVPA